MEIILSQDVANLGFKDDIVHLLKTQDLSKQLMM